MKKKKVQRVCEVDVYESTDGRQFDTKEDCKRHELFLKSRKKLMQNFFQIERIQSADGYGLDVQDSNDARFFRWYLPKTLWELEVIIEVYGGKNNIFFFNSDYEEYIGKPICVASEDNPYTDPDGNLNAYNDTCMMSFEDRMQYFAQIGRKLGYAVTVTRNK